MLVVHRSSSGAVLARELALVLAGPATDGPAEADPFAPEVVAVPAKGVERWLAQRLSHVLGTSGTAGSAAAADGICANVAFVHPVRLLEDALRASSPGAQESVEAWSPARVVWPLLEVLDGAAGEPWCRPLAAHLATAGGQRLALASRLARSLAEYGRSRPQMLRAWGAGEDEDGDGRPLAADLRWQAELFRHLRHRLAVPAPAELLDQACAQLCDSPGLVALPPRLSVLGASRLAPSDLTVLAALATHRDVHLWLHHASPALWETAAGAAPVLRRADDTTRAGLANPLLASLSRDVLELQHLLQRHAPAARHVHHPEAPGPTAPTGPPTLLARLRADLAADRVPTDPPPLDPADRSVQVHACHGRARQVEVLREAVLGLLARDATLEPRDVLVMCPDVETFAPLVAAAFSVGSEEDAPHPAARLRVRLADRSLRRTNPLLDVLATVLELAGSRVTAGQVLDLAGKPAVRQRCGLDDDDLERLRTWVAGSGVRWGLDGEHRAAWQLEGLAQGTWRTGLDRLLLGVAMEGDVLGPGQVVPLDDVDSADIDLAGRFAELLDRLEAAVGFCAGEHTAAGWVEGLGAAVLGLAGAAPGEAWQEAVLRSELADVAEAAAGSDVRLGLADVRTLLADALAGRPTRSSFRTGTLTVCTMVPMRSVPHRVVCLLGLDDGSFPRKGARDGDDVLARDPWVGERDPRSEDRQLLLDALLAATDHLVVTYAGADERTGATIPPAVPLGEVLDALDRTARAPDGRRVRDVITTRHPLQPFDARNFAAGALAAGDPLARTPFSFDPLALAGARAAAGERTSVPPFLTDPLPAPPAADVDLADLHSLLQHPARGFLRQRLGVGTAAAEEDPDDALPVELDNLEEWALGDRLLGQRLAGREPAECIALERARGSLPPGPLGPAVLAKVGRAVEALVGATAALRGQAPEAHDVDVDLGDGTRLTGTVSAVRGDVLLATRYARLSAGHRLRAWVDLVALGAAHPHRPWRAVLVGRDGPDAARYELGPLPPGQAQAALVELVALYRAGLRTPLPLPVRTAHAYAEQRDRRRPVAVARTRAAQRWVTDRYEGEQADPAHTLVHGADAPLAVLTRHPLQPGEGGEGWPPEETDRFGMLARRLWGRVLQAERGAAS